MSDIRRGLPAVATAGIAAPADKRFRRPDARPGRRRGPAATARRAAAFIVLGVLVILALASLVNRMVGSSFLAVSRLVITGNSRLSSGDIEVLMAGIRHESVLRVDLDRYRRRLLDSPWVQSATLWRRLPATVEIKVVEKSPMAVARQEDQLYLIDDIGTIIDEFGPAYRGLDLPVVDGVLHAAPKGVTADPARMAMAARCITEVQAAPDVRSRVSQMDVTALHDVVVLLDNDPTLVHVGDQQFAARIRRWIEIGPRIRQDGKALEYVDVRFDGKLFVKPRGAAVGRAGKPAGR